MTTFLIMIVIFVVLVFAGIPIAFCIGISSMSALLIDGISLEFMAQSAFSGLNSFTYLAIPMFILAGLVMESGGLSKRIVAFASTLVGNVYGGLGIIAVIACAFFAAISGSSPATVAAIGSMLVPTMIRKGYDKDFSGALVASSGTLGVLIPPSIPMILFAVTAEVSVSKMFMAGFLPGFLLTFALCVLVNFISRKKGYKTDEGKFHLANVWQKFKEAFWALMAPVIILGGIYLGFFTATEASVVAVIYSLLVGLFIYKEIKLKELPGIFTSAVTTTGTVVIILGFATTFATYLIMSGIPDQLGTAILSVTNNRLIILTLFVVLVFFTGMFIETAALILIYTPLFLPMLRNLGVDPIHFGIIMVMGTQLGMMTPPVGVNLFVAQGISGSSIPGLTKKIMPFIFVMLAVQLVLIYVPQIVMFLPNFVK